MHLVGEDPVRLGEIADDRIENDLIVEQDAIIPRGIPEQLPLVLGKVFRRVIVLQIVDDVFLRREAQRICFPDFRPA